MPNLARQCSTLIVGAGPSGLTLAAGLAPFGVQFRVIDRALDRAYESRALGVQARSLEILQSLGLEVVRAELAKLSQESRQ